MSGIASVLAAYAVGLGLPLGYGVLLWRATRRAKRRAARIAAKSASTGTTVQLDDRAEHKGT